VANEKEEGNVLRSQPTHITTRRSSNCNFIEEDGCHHNMMINDHIAIVIVIAIAGIVL
jgi:hypothetical protein